MRCGRKEGWTRAEVEKGRGFILVGDVVGDVVRGREVVVLVLRKGVLAERW